MSTTTTTSPTDALAARLKQASDAYYNGQPIMTDAAFDALEAQLRALDPQHAWFTQVGAVAPSNGAWLKVRHTMPMGSLNKSQTEADFLAWHQSAGGARLAITDKCDGMSICLVYKGRQLVQAITRGDGEIGEDITRNVLLMQGAVKRLPSVYPNGSTGSTQTPDLVYVRGEIVCTKSDFAANFPGESNPRNTASGTSKRQTGPDKCRYLTILAYQFLPNGEALGEKGWEIAALRDMGFSIPSFTIATTTAEAVQVYNDYVATKRAALDYDIDGLVIEVNSRNVREAMGERNHRPAGATAFKFPHDAAPTTLRSIRWQVGASGRVTPVAEFDVTLLAGAKVVQASLHNVANIARLIEESGINSTQTPPSTCLCEGDQILVCRRNDVIPYVEELLSRPLAGAVKELTTPTACPECSTVLVMNGEYLVCPNGDGCPAQISGALKRWISKIGVLHFGDALVDLLCEAGKVSGIADLYRLDPKDVAVMDMGGRRVGGTADKAIANLLAKRVLPLHVFVGSLGIPLIGRSMAKTIVDAGFDSLNKMSKAKVADIAAIPGVGPTKAEAFCDGFWDLLDRGVITDLLAVGVQIAQQATGAMSGKSMCQTGFRDAGMVTAFETAGGTVKSGVSKDLTYLVADDPTSNSGKAQKARQYGVQVIGITDMWTLLGGKP